MPTIVYSTLDLAGKNIAAHLIAKHGFAEAEKIAGFRALKNPEGISLVEIDCLQVTAEFLDVLKTDLIVFASKHKSESGKKSLTAHMCGNWNEKADLGGKPRSLSPTSPRAIGAAIRKIAEMKPKFPTLAEFDVVLECTHHGPLLQTPNVFVEIGSSEKEWGIPEAGEVIAEACLAACRSLAIKDTRKIAIGIGGIHYPHEISKRILSGEFDIGHICPKHAIEFLDEKMLAQMIEKSGKVEIALIDWKSLKAPEREKVMEMLKAFNIPFEKA